MSRVPRPKRADDVRGGGGGKRGGRICGGSPSRSGQGPRRFELRDYGMVQAPVTIQSVSRSSSSVSLWNKVLAPEIGDLNVMGVVRTTFPPAVFTVAA